MIKNTVIVIAIIIGLYYLEVQVVVVAVDSTITFWNDATIYVTTFKDRHPWIMLALPAMVLILLGTMKGVPRA